MEIWQLNSLLLIFLLIVLTGIISVHQSIPKLVEKKIFDTDIVH